MISGAWPEGTRLRIKATRDPADVDLNGQAWHTEGRTYELEVRAEDEMDRSTGVANHVRLVDCEVHRAGHLQASSSSVRQGAASMQGVFKPERLRMLNERHWQQALLRHPSHVHVHAMCMRRDIAMCMPCARRLEPPPLSRPPSA